MNDFTCICWGGDINSDFIRNTGFVQSVDRYIGELNLVKSWDKFNIDFTHVHEAGGQTFVSKIDHFFWNQGFSDNVSDAGVLHLVDNMSDHEVIYCVADTDGFEEVSLQKGEAKTTGSKPSWSRATPEQRTNFTEDLQQRLADIAIPDSVRSCCDVHCDDDEHKNDCDDFMAKIIGSMETAAKDTLHCEEQHKDFRNGKKRPVPGFNENVRPFRDTALFWNAIWQSCGKPINCEVHNIMKRTRNVYHYHWRKCRRAENKIKRSKLLDACINGGSDLLVEIKKLRK